MFLCNSVQGDLETRSSQQLNPSTGTSPDMEKLARFTQIFSVLLYNVCCVYYGLHVMQRK